MTQSKVLRCLTLIYAVLFIHGFLGFCIAAPTNGSNETPYVTGSWQEVIDSFRARVRVMDPNESSYTWKQMMDAVPDSAWQNPEFHRALSEVARQVGGTRWSNALYEPKFFMPSSAMALMAFERNPQLLTIWFPLTQRSGRRAAWQKSYNQTGALLVTLNKLPPSARALYRPWLQAELVRVIEKMQSKVKFEPKKAIPEGSKFDEMILASSPEDERSRALLEHPRLLAKITAFLSARISEFAKDPQDFARNFYHSDQANNFLLTSAVLESLAPELIRYRNSKSLDPFAHLVVFYVSPGRDFLNRHFNEINIELRGDLYDDILYRPIGFEEHRKIMARVEEKLMWNAPPPPTTPELTQTEINFSDKIEAFAEAGYLAKFSDNSIARLARYTRTVPSDAGFRGEAMVNDVLASRPELARRLARELERFDVAQLQEIVQRPKPIRSKNLRERPLMDLSRNELWRSMEVAFAKGHVASAAEDLNKLYLGALSESITVHDAPEQNLPDEFVAQLRSDAQSVIDALAEARARLSVSGLHVDPLLPALKSLEDLLFQSPPQKVEGPLNEREIAFRQNQERVRKFGTTDIDVRDPVMMWEDRQIRSRSAMLEGPARNGAQTAAERRRLEQQQKMIERDLSSWSGASRGRLLRNLRATLVRTEQDLANYGIKLFDIPWRHLNDEEFALRIRNKNLEKNLVAATVNAGWRHLLFTHPFKPVTQEHMMETALLTLSVKSNIDATKRALHFLDAAEFNKTSSEGLLYGLRSLRDRTLTNLDETLAEKIFKVWPDTVSLINETLRLNSPEFWAGKIDNARAREREGFFKRAALAREARKENFVSAGKFMGMFVGGVIGLAVGAVGLAHGLIYYLDHHPSHSSAHNVHESPSNLFGNVQTQPSGLSGPEGSHADDKDVLRDLSRVQSPDLDGLRSAISGGSRANNGEAEPPPPNAPRPFSSSNEGDGHNVSPPRAGTNPTFDIGDTAVQPRRENLRAFHFGVHSEFQDASMVTPVQLRRGDLNGYHMYVRTHEEAPTILSRDGIGLMPTPDDSELIHIKVNSVSANGITRSLEANQFEVLRNNRWGDYAIHVFNSEIPAVHYLASYRPVAHDASGENTLIPGRYLSGVSTMLNQAAFRPLSRAIDLNLRYNPKGISFGDFAQMVSLTGVYSHRTDTGLPTRTTRAEYETNPLFPMTRFRNEQGQFAGTCGSFANFTNTMLNAAYHPVGHPIAELRPAFLNGNGDDHLTLEDELHARTGVTLPGGPSFIVDSTSGIRDSSPGSLRVDPLPGGDPVSQNARYTDYRNLVLYAFLGGERRRREYFEWSRHMREVADRNNIDIDKALAEGEVETEALVTEEVQNPAETSTPDAPLVPVQRSIPTEHADEPSELDDQKSLEEIRTRSNPGYELMAGISNQRRELIKRQTELRKRNAIGKTNENPAAYVLQIDRSLRSFLNGDLSVEKLNSNLGLEFREENAKPTLQEWQALLKRLGEISQKRADSLRRFRDQILPRLSDGKTNRQTLSPNERFLVENFSDPLYLEATITAFEGLRSLSQNLTADHLAAITERRLRLPEEHREIWGPIGVMSLNGQNPMNWKESRTECLTRSLEQAFTDGGVSSGGGS